MPVLSDGSAGGAPLSVDRSSGAPAARPPGAPTGSLESYTGDWATRPGMVPSVRGAPGAFGLADGSNASPRRPGVAAGGGAAGGDVPGGRAAGAERGAAPPSWIR